MGNERNVEALSRVLYEVGVAERSLDLAEALAARGVLVPSALSEDELVKIGADATGKIPTDRSEIALCVREGLERIAKGSG